MSHLTRSHCRLCGNRSLVSTFSLGSLAVSDFVTTQADILHAPLTLALCDPRAGGCGLVQLAHRPVEQDRLYRQYWYRSGTNESMRRALHELAQYAQQSVKLEPGDTIVDIGSNDGTLLSYFPSSLTRVGFEPARNVNLVEKLDGATIIPDYFSRQAFFDALGANLRAKLITSVAMFYDLDDPNRFVADLRELLHPDGIWVNQLSYLPSMLTQTAFDNICHEHLTYYSLTTLATLLARQNMEIVDATTNDVNGGSFRVLSAHRGRYSVSARVQNLFKTERLQALDDPATYVDFATRVKTRRRQTRALLRRLKHSGKRIGACGASTKGNTLLQYFGLNRDWIDAIADRNPMKWNTRTVVTDIPIISEQSARNNSPEYMLVLPWHFRESIIAREQDYLAAGGALIFPLPELSIVTASGTTTLP